MYGKALAKQKSLEIDAKADPYSDAPDYNKAETAQIIKMLEAQISELENKGLGDSAEALELTGELADWYYSLAELETDDGISESLVAEARLLENTAYEMTPAVSTHDIYD
jgi:hypothetical protein